MGPNHSLINCYPQTWKDHDGNATWQNACRVCSSHQHGRAESGDKPQIGSAWGQTCKVCGKQNHFERVCQSKVNEKRGAIWYIKKEEDVMEALIMHIVFDLAANTYKPGNNNGHEEVDATVILFSPCPNPWLTRDISTTHSTRLRIYLDSGVTIYHGRLKYLWHMGLSERNLAPSLKKVRTVGGFSLVCQGWWPVTFKVGKRTMKQALYICRKLRVIYFSKAAYIDVGILSPCFPKHMTSPSSVTCNAVHPDIQHH